MYPLLLFFLFPYANDNRRERFPWMTILLILVTLAAFAGQASMHVAGQDAALADKLVFRPHQSPWYSFFTYAFLHAGPLHLFFNLWLFWLIGGQVEQRMGSLGFLAFYLGSGFCAALAHGLYFRLVHPEMDALGLIGASGCIYGVMGAYFLLYPFEEFRFWYFMFLRWGTLKIATVFFVTYKVFGDVLFAVVASKYRLITNVGHWAHLGGLAFGVGVAWAIFGSYALTGQRRLTPAEERRQRRLRRIARRKFYSDGPLPEPMTEAEFQAATEDCPPLEAIRRGMFFHNGRMTEWGYQEMLLENPKVCLEPAMQLDMINMLLEHGRDGLAEVAAWNLLEAHPDTPEAIQVRFELGRMLARLPEMRKTAVRLLREFLAAEPVLRERLEAEHLLGRLDERPLDQWEPKGPGKERRGIRGRRRSTSRRSSAS